MHIAERIEVYVPSASDVVLWIDRGHDEMGVAVVKLVLCVDDVHVVAARLDLDLAVAETMDAVAGGASESW